MPAKDALTQATDKVAQCKEIFAVLQEQLAAATKAGDKKQIAAVTAIIARGKDYIAARMAPDKVAESDVAYASKYDELSSIAGAVLTEAQSQELAK